jgi:hypothetical protein
VTMIFQRENCKPIDAPSERKLALELSRTRMSFATLGAKTGQYVQVAGGPGLFLLERHEADGTHYRAFQKTPVASHPDGTKLMFSGGSVSMAQRDWFLLQQVIEVFGAYVAGRELPTFVQWNKVEFNTGISVERI